MGLREEAESNVGRHMKDENGSTSSDSISSIMSNNETNGDDSQTNSNRGTQEENSYSSEEVQSNEESEDEKEEYSEEESGSGEGEEASEPENDESFLEAKEKENDDDTEDKSGWADAMAKVLNMGKNTTQTDPTKPLFLSKAIKDNECKQNNTVNAKDSGTGDDKKDKDVTVRAPTIRASIRRAQKKEMEEKGRCKPDVVKDKVKEKMLCKLATKGVVQLFNAVREQQKSIKTQLNSVGGSIRKREKLYKNIDRQAFLNVLTNKESIGNENFNTNNPLKKKSTTAKKEYLQKRLRKGTSTSDMKTDIKEEDDIKEENLDDDDGGGNASTWNVFRDDFMMGAKMKDWDKEDSDADG